MPKKTVSYKELVFCKVGCSALLFPVDHPGPHVSNTKYTRTSVVQSYDPATGVIETMNSIYRPMEGMPVPTPAFDYVLAEPGEPTRS